MAVWNKISVQGYFRDSRIEEEVIAVSDDQAILKARIRIARRKKLDLQETWIDHVRCKVVATDVEPPKRRPESFLLKELSKPHCPQCGYEGVANTDCPSCDNNVMITQEVEYRLITAS